MVREPQAITIALIGPIGVNLDSIETDIASELENNYKFKIQPLKITDLKLFQNKPLPEDRFKRYMKLMDLGDKARRTSGKRISLQLKP